MGAQDLSHWTTREVPRTHFKNHFTFQFSFEDFKKNANFIYDNGFGEEGFASIDIDTSIVIVFKDGSWLERSYYDGAEWWDYKKCPSFKEMSNDVDIYLRNFPM